MSFVQVYDGFGNAPRSISHIHLDFEKWQIKYGIPSDTQETDRSGAKRIAALRIASLTEEQVSYLVYHMDVAATIISVTDETFLHSFLLASVKSCMLMGDLHVVTLSYGSYDFTRLNEFPPGHRFT